MKLGPCEVYLACGTAYDIKQGKEKREENNQEKNIHRFYNLFS